MQGFCPFLWLDLAKELEAKAKEKVHTLFWVSARVLFPLVVGPGQKKLEAKGREGADIL